MLKEHTRFLRVCIVLIDICVIAASFFSAYFFINAVRGLYHPSLYVPYLPFLIIVWEIFLARFGLYASLRFKKFFDVFFIIIKAGVLCSIFFAFYMYIFKITHMSRLFIISFFSFSCITLFIIRMIIMLLFRQVRKKGYNFREILLVGSGKKVTDFIDAVREHGEWGIRFIGIVTETQQAKEKNTSNDIPVLGTAHDLPEILKDRVVDEVIFMVSPEALHSFEDILHYIEIQGIRMSIAADYVELKLAKSHYSYFHGIPFITFESTSNNIWQLVVKRIADLLISSCFLLLLSPLFICIALIIKMTSPGPILFCQKRVSLNGRIFILYKFRTMIDEAEKHLPQYASFNNVQAPAFKMDKDPRITSCGRWLRKFSLDELPQLWNVLMGDMSLIGPRPALPGEVEQYEPWQRRRLSMRPGITCLWQVQGRSDIIHFDTWMHLDLYYIDHWSLWLDIKIFLKTIPVVFTGSGAR